MSEISAYRVREAARLLGVTKKALRDQIAAKTVESYRAKGKRYVVLPTDPLESPDADDAVTITQAKGPGQDLLEELLAIVNCQADRITELSHRLDVIQAEMRGVQQRIGQLATLAGMPAPGDTDSVSEEAHQSVQDSHREALTDRRALAKQDDWYALEVIPAESTAQSQAEDNAETEPTSISDEPARVGQTIDSSTLEVAESASNRQPSVDQMVDTEPWHRRRSTPVWRDRSFVLKPLVVAAGLLVLLVFGPLTPLPFPGSHAGVIAPRSQVTEVPIRNPRDPEYVPPHDTMRLPTRASQQIRRTRGGAKHRAQRSPKG